MNVQKIIFTTQDIDVDLTGATLLSIEEYKAYKDVIPDIDNWWWLRSPGYYASYAAFVGNCGFVCTHGYYVLDDSIGVRPALCFNQSGNPLIKGDKVLIGGYKFTVISDNMMLCDTAISNSCFSRTSKTPYINDYEKSCVKKVVDKWFENIKEAAYANI